MSTSTHTHTLTRKCHCIANLCAANLVLTNTHMACFSSAYLDDKDDDDDDRYRRDLFYFCGVNTDTSVCVCTWVFVSSVQIRAITHSRKSKVFPLNFHDKKICLLYSNSIYALPSLSLFAYAFGETHL